MEGRLKVEFFDSHAHYDDEKFNDNGTITLPAVYDDELIDDINKLKG